MREADETWGIKRNREWQLALGGPEGRTRKELLIEIGMGVHAYNLSTW